jgi:hypothetical protein
MFYFTEAVKKRKKQLDLLLYLSISLFVWLVADGWC